MAAVRKRDLHANDVAGVDAYMDRLEHPFKAEVQALREIITGVDTGITQQVKWNAPSFSYKDYLATFNLRATQHVHLVFHNGAILDNSSGLLEGKYPDRRMAYFTSMDDVNNKRAALESIVREWIQKMNEGVKL